MAVYLALASSALAEMPNAQDLVRVWDDQKSLAEIVVSMKREWQTYTMDPATEAKAKVVYQAAQDRITQLALNSTGQSSAKPSLGEILAKFPAEQRSILSNPAGYFTSPESRKVVVAAMEAFSEKMVQSGYSEDEALSWQESFVSILSDISDRRRKALNEMQVAAVQATQPTQFDELIDAVQMAGIRAQYKDNPAMIRYLQGHPQMRGSY